MGKKASAIPVNYFETRDNAGIEIDKMSLPEMVTFTESKEPHRHDCHSIFFLETGTVTMAIDFNRHTIRAPAVIYMHPNQVHLVLAFKNVSVTSFAITNENLHPEYRQLLEGLTPAAPISLKKEALSIVSEAASLCMKLAKRERDKLYHSLLKDSCNAFVAFIISLYLEKAKPADKLTRFETVTKAFNEKLEQRYSTVKSPAAYAKALNISTPYLNECVKHTTGYSVSHHIQQRVILEAKRMLYHSDISVKEIATALGFDDYPYFSRLFTRVAGMSALAFRRKNHE
jgi:AraC-like DNA-binding protein/mannose-6-phosphate isomerase-like protein (cupin superfamily)